MWLKLTTATFTTNIGTLSQWSISCRQAKGVNPSAIDKKADLSQNPVTISFENAITLSDASNLQNNFTATNATIASVEQVTEGKEYRITFSAIDGDVSITVAVEEEEPDMTLDSIAYGGKTYREIFINKNIMPNINNNVLLSNAADTVVYAQYKSEYPATIKQSTAAETNYVPSYYMDVSGTESRYLQRDSANSSSDGAAATAGEIFFGGVNVKITEWAAGRVGINVGSNYALAVADRVTNGYERLTVKITASKDAGYFVGSTGKASLTGYINNPVLVRGSIFGSNMPSESEWTTLYNNYCEILCNNA